MIYGMTMVWVAEMTEEMVDCDLQEYGRKVFAVSGFRDLKTMGEVILFLYFPLRGKPILIFC